MPWLQSEAKVAARCLADALACNQRRRHDGLGSRAGHGQLQSEVGPGSISNKQRRAILRSGDGRRRLAWRQGSGGHISLRGMDAVDSKDRVGEGAARTQTQGMVWIEDWAMGVNRLNMMGCAQLIWCLSIC
jgi:hypothetical protein